MVTKIKNVISSKITDKIRRLNLSLFEKETIEQVLNDPPPCVIDNRFRRSTVMSTYMEQEIDVIPGSSLKDGQEEVLFLQMNYARYRLGQVRNELLRRSRWPKKLILELLDWHHQQQRSRSKIVTGNMGLVLAMAKRVDYPGVEFCDLISEGSMALLRGTDKFDCSRGFKFSTYACRAILKGFSRIAKQSYRYHRRFPAQLDTTMIKDDHEQNLREEVHEDLVDEVRVIMHNNLADLSGIEESVLNMRFSLKDEEMKPLTLKQVGARLGLTKERIRQIQNNALSKLRVITETRMTTV